MKPQKAPHTAVELLVLIVIIVLVPVSITASLQTARNLAKIPICANNLRQIGAAVYDYAQIYDGNLPNVVQPLHISSTGRDEVHPYVAYRSDHEISPGAGKLQPYRLACLYEAGLIDPRLFYCPANADPGRMFKSYNNPEPWGTLPQVYNTQTGSNQWVRLGYEWFPVDENPELERLSPVVDGVRLPPPPKRLCRKFDNLDPNLPYCTDAMRTRDWITHRYDEVIGLNVLYKDGHVFFQDDPNIFTDRAWDLEPSGRNLIESTAIYYYHILLLANQVGGTE